MPRPSPPTLLRLHSSYRTRPAADTLAVGCALMPSLGISRVTDITRMDRLGLPVCASVRPRSRGLRVHAGKGLSDVEARASALMEAVEHAVAEPHASDWVARTLAMGDIAAQFAGRLRIADFVPTARAALEPRTVVVATECEELGRPEPVQLPAEVVFYPHLDDASPQLFGATTNGLASGNTLEEATLHALLEVLERDALALNRPRDASQWVDSDDLPEPFRHFARTWRKLGVALAVRHVPNDFGLPCFEAMLRERRSADVDLAAGSGLHVDRHVALARAVCEAAQSRLSTIHGGRDDITDFYAKYTTMSPARRKAAERRVTAGMFDRTRTVGWSSIPHRPGDGRPLPAVLDDVLGAVSRAGFPAVFRHAFRVRLAGLHVVKVIVPASENVEADPRRIGRRLLDRIMAHA
jgi:ribosomal protein S12 methylthiotransferase accessory factor